MVKVKFIVLITLMTCGSANSENLPSGTINAYFQQLSRAGVPDGCSLVFVANTSDTAYLKGAQVTMSGSIAVRDMNGTSLTFTGKLGTRAFDLLNSQWVAPHSFYFSSKNGTTAGKVKLSKSETPGYKLSIGSALDDPVAGLVIDIAKTGLFVVGFNRREGGQDVYSAIDISVALKATPGGRVLTVNESTRKDFDACVTRLISNLKDKLEIQSQ